MSYNQESVAERQGFEPWKELPPCWFSRTAERKVKILGNPLFSALLSSGNSGKTSLFRWFALEQKLLHPFSPYDGAAQLFAYTGSPVTSGGR